MSKKIKKVKKSGKIKKKSKKPNREKKPIKPIKIFKKPAGSVRFWFYKPKTKKKNRTEPNLNRKNKKNLSQTGKKPSQTKKPSKIDLN